MSYVTTAKERCYFLSKHDLTCNESASIYIYTMKRGETDLHRVLNKALRDEDLNALIIWFSYPKLFNSALDKPPTVHAVVWCGVSNDTGDNMVEYQFVFFID